MEIGSTVKMPLDKEPLHEIVCGYSIDGEEGIKNPLNLEGVKLGIQVNIITINSSVLRNMSKCVSQAGFVPAGFVFSGLASAGRVLTGEDRQSGAAFLEVCNDLTEVLVFHRGILKSCKVLPVGTKDIVTESGGIDKDALEKLLSQVALLPGWEKIQKIVTIGEGTLKDDLVESLEEFFKIPIMVGTCIAKPFEDLLPERAEYIGSLGILDHLQQEKEKQRLSGSVFKRSLNKVLTFIDKYF